MELRWISDAEGVSLRELAELAAPTLNGGSGGRVD